MKVYIVTITLLLIGVSNIKSQVTFTDGTKNILGDKNIHSTICIAVDDVNSDGRDDLILLDAGKYLKIFTQGDFMQPFDYKLHNQVSANGDWAIVTGDLNNNGVPEILSSGVENGTAVLFKKDGKYKTKYNTQSIFSQNSNLVDINNDGFLDFFVCNDDGENLIYINDGAGNLEPQKIIDFKTSNEDDMSGNYSSIFTDIDNDGDLDLYIAKCRAGVNNPNDRRRINTLYINNGDGTYFENAESYGIASGEQSWSVDFGDVDNDGDMDMFVANHTNTHELMINDGNGHFDSFQYLNEKISSGTFQSYFADFDNNGWLDIFICGGSENLIIYNDNMVFTKSVYLKSNSTFSAAIGDFNDDGFLDIYKGHASDFDIVGLNHDIALINEGNSNNFVDITLIGTDSNHDGIGAKVYIHHANGVQTREITAGKSYGIMNSTVAHFGLKNDSWIEKIIVLWPSGNITTLDDGYDVNTKYTIQENGCFTQKYRMTDYILCDGESIEIEIPNIHDKYLWSNGAETKSISVDSPGLFSFTVWDGICKTESYYFKVIYKPNFNSSNIVDKLESFTCLNEETLLSAVPGWQYLWSTGETADAIVASDEGEYTVTVSTNCSTIVSDTITSYKYANSETITNSDTVINEGVSELMLKANGNNPQWFLNEKSILPFATGNTVSVFAIHNDTTFFVENGTVNYGIQEYIMPIVPLNIANDTLLYTKNDTIRFSVFDDIELQSFDVRTQVEGTRSIVIKGKDGIVVFQYENLFSVGKTTVMIDKKLKKGEYKIYTNMDTNMEQLGSAHPQFSSTNSYTSSEKSKHGYFNISDSKLYEDRSPYFFNWKINYGAYYCAERVAVNVHVNPVNTIELTHTLLSVFPNPNNGILYISTEMEYPVDVEIFDNVGRKVLAESIETTDNSTINHNLSTGIYTIKIKSDEEIGNTQIIVIKD
ncbi:MAG: FG-GAP-like repeat-containing protein [Saprospiraceae bacterium]